MNKLKGMTALITGGGTGIGRAIAESLIKNDCDVIITGRREQVLQQTSREINCDYFVCDITRSSDREALYKQVMQRYNTLDILVNNAGIFLPGKVEEVREDDYDRTFEVNVKALYFLTQLFLPHFKERNRGYIINISSHAGKRGLPESSIYCASKFAVMGINDSLNAELKGTGIRVGAICPGYVATPMTSRVGIPQEEMIQPEDIARAVLFLLSLSHKAWTREIIIEWRP